MNHAGDTRKPKTRRHIQTPGSDTQNSGIYAILQKYLTAMKKDHVYMARSVLAAARLDLNQQERIRKEERPGVIYDEEDPFMDMARIDVPETEAGRRDGVTFKVTFYKKANVATVNYICAPTTMSKVSPGTPLPRKCRNYTTLRNNILADNEEEMRYLPYFGEAADDDEFRKLHLEDLYIDKTNECAEEGRIMECMFRTTSC